VTNGLGRQDATVRRVESTVSVFEGDRAFAQLAAVIVRLQDAGVRNPVAVLARARPEASYQLWSQRVKRARARGFLTGATGQLGLTGKALPSKRQATRRNTGSRSCWRAELRRFAGEH
jgi:hypothetical protein